MYKRQIFIYHGDCDDVVPITESVNMLKAVNRNGGNAKMKICYGIGHNAWDVAYTDESLLEWIMKQEKTSPDRGDRTVLS